jgi:hypothetical protein
VVVVQMNGDRAVIGGRDRRVQPAFLKHAPAGW